MKRIAETVVALGLSLAPILSGWAAEPSAEQAKAVAEIRKLAGKVTVDEESPGKPVKSVDLPHTKVTDAGLVHLEGLTQLRGLALMQTRVTDAGVKRLQKALPNCKIVP